MEQIIENAVDKGLDNIAAQLYLFSVGFGIVLIIIGLVLYTKGKGSKDNRIKANVGLISMIIGIVAIVSGLVQLF